MIKTEKIIRGSVGYLLGEMLSLGLEEAISSFFDVQNIGDTAIDLPDHALGIIGASIGLDESLCNTIAKQIRRKFGKSWSNLSKEEWNKFGEDKPDTAEYLKEALKI